MQASSHLKEHSVDELTAIVVAALDAIKGEAIEVFDTSAVTPLFERVVVASGNSTRQVKALARHVLEESKKMGITLWGIEGEALGEWILIDLGSVVVHIMLPAVRAYYRLEELWGMPPASRIFAAPSQRAARNPTAEL